MCTAVLHCERCTSCAAWRRSSGRQWVPQLAAPRHWPLVSAGCGPAGGVRGAEEVEEEVVEQDVDTGARRGGRGGKGKRRRRRRPAISESCPALPEEASCCSGPSKRSLGAPDQSCRALGLQASPGGPSPPHGLTRHLRDHWELPASYLGRHGGDRLWCRRLGDSDLQPDPLTTNEGGKNLNSLHSGSCREWWNELGFFVVVFFMCLKKIESSGFVQTWKDLFPSWPFCGSVAWRKSDVCRLRLADSSGFWFHNHLPRTKPLMLQKRSTLSSTVAKLFF